MTNQELNKCKGMKQLIYSTELIPNDRQKSFYGKAKVKTYTDGTRVLQSYKTDVLIIRADGKMFRMWDSWSATTGRHIKAFSGLNKKEYLELPLINTL